MKSFMERMAFLCDVSLRSRFFLRGHNHQLKFDDHSQGAHLQHIMLVHGGKGCVVLPQ